MLQSRDLQQHSDSLRVLLHSAANVFESGPVSWTDRVSNARACNSMQALKDKHLMHLDESQCCNVPRCQWQRTVAGTERNERFSCMLH